MARKDWIFQSPCRSEMMRRSRSVMTCTCRRSQASAWSLHCFKPTLSAYVLGSCEVSYLKAHQRSQLHQNFPTVNRCVRVAFSILTMSSVVWVNSSPQQLSLLAAMTKSKYNPLSPTSDHSIPASSQTKPSSWPSVTDLQILCWAKWTLSLCYTTPQFSAIA